MKENFNILKLTEKPDEQLLHLLESNLIGTPGVSMLYYHADVRKKVQTLSNATFCNLSIRQRLYGTICFCRRKVVNNGVESAAYYIRYFTFQELFRSAGSKIRQGKKSAVRQEVQRLMDGHGLEHSGSLLLYAYVDAENTRSSRLIKEFGFKHSGHFHTIPFSRLFRRISPAVQRLQPDELPKMNGLLTEYYKDFNLVSFEHLFRDQNYFIIKEQEEIVCGAQAIPDRWNIVELPGLSGRFMMKILPKIPLLRRLFQEQYKFVFLETIYCKPGYEKQLGVLLESVLGIFQMHSGILCVDPQSSLYRQVAKLSPGLTHKIMGEKSIEIFIKSPDANLLSNKSPFFVSGYDVL